MIHGDPSLKRPPGDHLQVFTVVVGPVHEPRRSSGTPQCVRGRLTTVAARRYRDRSHEDANEGEAALRRDRAARFTIS